MHFLKAELLLTWALRFSEHILERHLMHETLQKKPDANATVKHVRLTCVCKENQWKSSAEMHSMWMTPKSEQKGHSFLYYREKKVCASLNNNNDWQNTMSSHCCHSLTGIGSHCDGVMSEGSNGLTGAVIDFCSNGSTGCCTPL